MVGQKPEVSLKISSCVSEMNQSLLGLEQRGLLSK